MSVHRRYVDGLLTALGYAAASEPELAQPGEAWLLAQDGEFLAAVVIASVHDGFVLGFPLSDHGGSAGPAELVVELNGTPFVVWPRLETGLGSFLLHSRLGDVLSEDQIREVRLWDAGEGELTTLDAGSGQRDAHVADELVDLFAYLCFLEPRDRGPRR